MVYPQAIGPRAIVPLVAAPVPRTLIPEVLAGGQGAVAAVPTTRRGGVRSGSLSDGVGTRLAFIMSLPLAPDSALVRHTGHVAAHLLGHLGGHAALCQFDIGAMSLAGGLLGMCPEGLHRIHVLSLSGDRYCTNFSHADQGVWRERCVEVPCATNRVPTPLDDQHTLAWEPILI